MIFDKMVQKYTNQSSAARIPLLNYAEYMAGNPLFQDYRQKNRKFRVMELVKNSPEVIALVRLVTGDICGPYHFEALDRSESGRNKIKRAQEFAVGTKFRVLMKNTLNDVLITGEGYNWIGLIPDELYQNVLAVLKTSTGKDLVSRAQKLKYVASTTMVTNHDSVVVTGYTQYLSTRDFGERTFDLSEFIKITFEELDGKVEGFTPLMTLPLQLELLWLMWQNQYSLQRRGNHPDLVVTATGVSENHPSYEKIKAELKSYNMPGRPTHGTLFFSGGKDAKLEIEQLEREDKLQFKEVDQYITSLIAMMWQIPAARLGIKTEQSALSKDSNSSADRAYWYNVDSMQEIVMEAYNTCFWVPFFGVRMIFDRSYLQDEVAEGNAMALKLANLNTMMATLAKKGKTLSEEVIVDSFNNRNEEICDDDIEDMSEEEKMANQPPGTGMLGKPKDASTQELAAEKQKSELNREKGAGKPTGS